jgi:hypothetical protein
MESFMETPEIIYKEAKAAGIAAGNAIKPIAMKVVGGGCEYLVEDGACGFASVIITPARGKFVSWCKANKIGTKSYYGGWEIFIHDHNQSMQRKEAHALAFVEVLKKHGLDCYMTSRMD